MVAFCTFPPPDTAPLRRGDWVTVHYRVRRGDHDEMLLERRRLLGVSNFNGVLCIDLDLCGTPMLIPFRWIERIVVERDVATIVFASELTA